jgi:hypothetical protein
MGEAQFCRRSLAVLIILDVFVYCDSVVTRSVCQRVHVGTDPRMESSVAVEPSNVATDDGVDGADDFTPVIESASDTVGIVVVVAIEAEASRDVGCENHGDDEEAREELHVD